ncbi:TetR/AcrR family transcriptional regulator [Aeribacillus pallidus]|uniref:TetR/AcrR family transcriptional regulator n=1 Tax=Aeribacillus pallidus TaxID=33936 RepID=UPI0013EEA44E|nr:TetR/AcrR family transcriptional regulator [Aeribacillus pallidus]
MRSSEKIVKAAIKLARHNPYNQITFADVAKEAGVHWTTVKRYFGSKDAMKTFFKEKQKNSSQTYSDTPTKILEAARKTFARYGYENTTLDQVAEEAGMTKGAVYWHFSSKSDLFLALIDQSLKKLIRGMSSQLQDVFSSSEPKQALQQLFESELTSCNRDQGEKPLLFFEFISKSREPEVRDKLSASFGQLFEETAETVREIQNKYLISSNLNANELAVTMHALINGAVLMWLIAPEKISLPALSEELAKVIWNGIKPDENLVLSD